jgi:hypothetical protein
MNFFTFFFFCGIFFLLDPDPATQIHADPEINADPQPCL